MCGKGLQTPTRHRHHPSDTDGIGPAINATTGELSYRLGELSRGSADDVLCPERASQGG